MKHSALAKPWLPIAIIGLFTLVGCGSSGSSGNSESDLDGSAIYYSTLSDIDDWTADTHEKLDTDAIIDNIDKVFDGTQVQKLRIVIEAENWALMNEDLSALNEELGNSNDFSGLDNPIFVPSSVHYYADSDTSSTQWYKVGVRFKGNSSLFNANSSKLPFKLDFDEFEDEYPDIKNQRFFGFKQLNLKNNYNDDSEMHEVVSNDLFRDFGLASAHSAFYALYLNVDGSDDESNDIYYGLYTLVEEVDDTVIETQYVDNDSGNLYKPEDDAATFAEGTYDEDEYDLKTDDDETYEDIAALYDIIHSDTRLSDTEQWMSDLEAIFDVDVFLKWLAANTVLQNWDTYGVMDHNFFLYHNPASDKFEWIPWDNNEALEDNNRALALSLSSVNEADWPLIGYLLAQDDYIAIYDDYVAAFADDYFNDSSSTRYNVNDQYEDYQDLIAEYVTSEGSDYTFTSERAFTEAVERLKTHSEDRYEAVSDYLR